MSASVLGARQRQGGLKSSRSGVLPGPKHISLVTPGPELSGGCGSACSLIDLGGCTRVSLILTPAGRGPFNQQARELLSTLQTSLGGRPRMKVVSQTVFLRDGATRLECQRLLDTHFGQDMPVTNYVSQPPCDGAALALEAWAVGGDSVQLERFSPQTMAVSYDGVRWVYCSGVTSRRVSGPVYPRATEVFRLLDGELQKAGSGFAHVVRTWLYLGGITESEGTGQRYHELNRARSDFYQGIDFCRGLVLPGTPGLVYPASTGIGMGGGRLSAACISFQTRREDASLVHLENPHQTPAYAYHTKYSPHSPKFSRGLALALGHHLTTWISGTASIVNSENRYPGDIGRQTEQTIENIERLLTRENFALHGLPHAGAGLGDLAKIRVYVRRPEDYAKCRAICERRFGAVPTIYALADICRPELLVEIEGVAFSHYSPR